jgi:CheY-like chemotaxis protein
MFTRILNSVGTNHPSLSSRAPGKTPDLARQQCLALEDNPENAATGPVPAPRPPHPAKQLQEVRIDTTRVGHILLVDDEDWCRETIQILLTELGYTVDSTDSAEDALKKFDPRQYQLVLTDNRMPGMSGVELAEQIKQRSPGTPILMYTALAPKGPLAADVVLEKPVVLQVLKSTLERLTCPKTR